MWQRERRRSLRGSSASLATLSRCQCRLLLPAFIQHT